MAKKSDAAKPMVDVKGLQIRKAWTKGNKLKGNSWLLEYWM